MCGVRKSLQGADGGHVCAAMTVCVPVDGCPAAVVCAARAADVGDGYEDLWPPVSSDTSAERYV